MNHSKLREKGWNERDLSSAAAILEQPKRHELHFSKMVFWSALLVIVFANLLISLVLIPFLIVLTNQILYAIVFLLALMIGFLYNFMITNSGYLDAKHHLSASVIVPVIALANMLVMVFISNQFMIDLQVNNPQHNPWLIAVIFAITLILPYLFGQIRTALRS